MESRVAEGKEGDYKVVKQEMLKGQVKKLLREMFGTMAGGR
jgi:hypothetical protein